MSARSYDGEAQSAFERMPEQTNCDWRRPLVSEQIYSGPVQIALQGLAEASFRGNLLILLV